ncbi:hypothetical protein QGP82_09040 [Leptothoe sp. LEGE 181152]|nr:hypothetical protein [Leptothoe sp. LEGE 181152]
MTAIYRAHWKTLNSIANSRFKELAPYLDSDAPTCPTRKLRRWRNNYLEAEAIYGAGYIGLLPKHKGRGNRLQKIDEITWLTDKTM